MNEHTSVEEFVPVEELQLGDRLFYRFAQNVLVHGTVSYISDDLKKIHITGEKFTDGEGSLITTWFRFWFPVEGFIYRYVERSNLYEGELYVIESVNNQMMLWRRKKNA